MGWKEAWEKYQIAVTFAEAGEHKMARRVLEEESQERLSTGKKDLSSPAPGASILRPSTAKS